MKSFFTTIICFITISCFSQLSLDIGTKWTYTSNDIASGTFNPAPLEIVGDTMIDNTKWYRHTGAVNCASDFENVLIRSEGQKVFMFYGLGNEVLLYDFDKVAGESWTIQIPGTGIDYEINVLSVETIEVEGKEYKIQNIDNVDFGNYIVEGIGSNAFFFPQGNICDPHFANLRCFSSGSEDVNFQYGLECDAVVFYLSSPYDSKRVKVDIFPNPTTDFMNVKFDSEVSLQNIALLDNMGKTIRTIAGTPNKLEYNIDLTNLLPGIYFINIQTKLGSDVKRIIKH